MPRAYRSKKYRGGSSEADDAAQRRAERQAALREQRRQSKNANVPTEAVNSLVENAGKEQPTSAPMPTNTQPQQRASRADLRQAALASGLTAGQAERFAGSAYYNPVTGSYQAGSPIAAGYQTGMKKRSGLPAGMSQERYKSLVNLSKNPEKALRQTAAALMPFMSPDGQTAVSKYLAEGTDELASVYQDYEVPSISTAEARATLLSRDKAVKAKQALDNMLNSLHIKAEDLGEGYKFLTDILNELEAKGTQPGAAPWSSAQYQEFNSSILDELDAAKENTSKAAFEPLARFLVTPYVNGQNVFRLTRNRKLFS